MAQKNPLVQVSETLNRDLRQFDSFKDPVEYIYRPLDYAWQPHRQYLERFGSETPREILMVGMNPGPWGMGQTGVPFGDIDFVGDWMGIDGSVGKPEREHPKKEVGGFDCHRNEVSGSRLWGWAKSRYGEAESFFGRYFVHNYFPLLLLEESGRNRTPNRLKADERRSVFPYCDKALRAIAEHLNPEFVIGIGAFATRRVEACFEDVETDFQIGRILHPSPANPHANKDWVGKAEESLEEVGIAV